MPHRPRCPCSRVESLEGKLRQVSEAENVVFQTPPELETEHNRMKQWMDQATHVITVLEKQVQSNSERIFHNVAKNFSDNVKISGIPEDKGSPLVATKWFLENILEIEDVAEADILEAARLPGTMTVNIKGVRVELPRQMFVKCTPLLCQEIDRVKPILNEKKDPLDGHFYRIKPHLPDIFAAARQHYAPLLNKSYQRMRTWRTVKSVHFTSEAPIFTSTSKRLSRTFSHLHGPHCFTYPHQFRTS